jgi:hypothetical protein
MQNSPQTASNSASASNAVAAQLRVGDLIYQAITVAAALWLLGSLWAF